MTTTFEIQMAPAVARCKFLHWDCDVQRVDGQTCNITFTREEEWKRFEDYAGAHGLEYRVV